MLRLHSQHRRPLLALDLYLLAGPSVLPAGGPQRTQADSHRSSTPTVTANAHPRLTHTSHELADTRCLQHAVHQCALLQDQDGTYRTQNLRKDTNPSLQDSAGLLGGGMRVLEAKKTTKMNGPKVRFRF